MYCLVAPVFLQSPVVAGVGFAGYTAYAPTKWAVRGLADTLRNEVRHRRILHTDAKAVLWCLGPTAVCCISFNAPFKFPVIEGVLNREFKKATLVWHCSSRQCASVKRCFSYSARILIMARRQ